MKKPLIIDPDDNPEMTALVERSNELVRQWGVLNRQVLQMRVPTLSPWRVKKPLVRICRESQDYEKQWSAWDLDARKFSLNPSLVIPAGGPSELTFLH